MVNKGMVALVKCGNKRGEDAVNTHTTAVIIDI
jgi:hypothetical protein